MAAFSNFQYFFSHFNLKFSHIVHNINLLLCYSLSSVHAGDYESLRAEMQSMKKASEAEVDNTSASTSKAGPSKQSVELSDPNIYLNPRTSDHSEAQPMETDFCGPSLPPRFGQSVQSDHGSKHSDLHFEHLDPHSEHSEQPQRVCSSGAKKHSDKKKHKVWAKYFSQSSSSEEDQFSVPIKKSGLLLSKTNNKITQTQSFTWR